MAGLDAAGPDEGQVFADEWGAQAGGQARQGLQPPRVGWLGATQRQRDAVGDDRQAALPQPLDGGRQGTPGIEILSEDFDEPEAGIAVNGQGQLRPPADAKSKLKFGHDSYPPQPP